MHLRMRRRRIVLRALCVIALTLTIGLWVRSHFYLETIAWIPAERSYSLFIERGDLGFMWWTKFVKGYHSGEHWLYYKAGIPASWPFDGKTRNADRGWVIRWGNQFERQNTGRPCGILVVPFWLIAFCFACPLAYAVLRRLFDPRDAGALLCRHCGYDLRATPQRCPECGCVPELEGNPGQSPISRTARNT